MNKKKTGRIYSVVFRWIIKREDVIVWDAGWCKKLLYYSVVGLLSEMNYILIALAAKETGLDDEPGAALGTIDLYSGMADTTD